MIKTIPTDGQLIGELIDSFGHLWGCDPPMYDAFTEVESSVQKGPMCHTVLYHVTFNVEGIEDLCESGSICGTRWKYTLDLQWSDQKDDWEFADSEMVDDQQIDLSDISENEVESLIEGIFQQLDFYDYLDANELTSAQLLESLHPTFRKHYMQYHKQFAETGLFQ
jgi:hypothetical protein